MGTCWAKAPPAIKTMTNKRKVCLILLFNCNIVDRIEAAKIQKNYTVTAFFSNYIINLLIINYLQIPFT